MSLSRIKAQARRALRWLCRWGLLLRSRPVRFSAADRVLILAPHSDDETLGCGALLADLVATGTSVHVAYFTDSAGSHRQHPSINTADLAARRQAEATHAMSLAGLSIQHLRWLGAPDGRLKDLSPAERSEWQSVLTRVLSELKPTVVLLPSRRDGSSEHEAMFRLLAGAVVIMQAAPRVIEFPVWSWWNPRFLWRQLWQPGLVWRHATAMQATRKHAMIACYHSQLQPVPPALTPALSAEFIAAFTTPHEFYFESTLPT